MKHAFLFVLLTFSFFARAEAGPAVEKDVVYGKCGSVELKLDLARPVTGNGPFPCLVFIHGGGWSMGTKASYDSAIQEAAKHGYIAATVEYRLAPKYLFPAQVEDCKCAVRYLRAHASELHINAAEFGAVGDSAGGHLSLMLGLMNKEDGLEGTGGNPEQSSKVQCVVNYYGPGDFTSPGDFNPLGAALVKGFLGTDDPSSPIVARASPATYIDKTDAPVLTFHGSKDVLVPVSMSQHLHELLKKAGVEEKLEILEGLGHGFAGADRAKTFVEAFEFLDKHLKK